MATQYIGSTKYTAVVQWAASTAYNVGDRRRPLAAPSVGNERVFRCTTAGTSGGSAPAWNNTAGATTADNTAVWTEVTGLSTYNSGGAWGAPHARIQNAFASGWMAAGDRGKVHSAHAATRSSAMTLTSPGTAASPCEIVCVNDGDTARATGALEVTTAGAIDFAGFCHSYGVTYQAGTSSTPDITFTSTSAWHWIIEQGALKLTVTIAANMIRIGQISGTSVGQLLEMIDSSFAFANVGSQILVGGQLIWRGGSILATVPTTLFGSATFSGDVLCEGVDLSAAGSGKTLCEINDGFRYFRVVNCKLGSAVAIASGTVEGLGGALVEVINSDSADTNYRFHRQNYAATETQETTIVRTGGASDGTTPMARKVVTTANTKTLYPYKSMPIEVWNEVVGSAITLSVPVITDGVTLTDADAWLEVDYLGTSGFPLALFASDRLSDPVFGSAANQTTDGTSTWTTTGLSSPVKQTLSVQLTPQEKGLIRARVVIAKASTTVYYDPLLLVT